LSFFVAFVADADDADDNIVAAAAAAAAAVPSRFKWRFLPSMVEGADFRLARQWMYAPFPPSPPPRLHPYMIQTATLYTQGAAPTRNPGTARTAAFLSLRRCRPRSDLRPISPDLRTISPDLQTSSSSASA
jgi:hypothetical protein